MGGVGVGLYYRRNCEEYSSQYTILFKGEVFDPVVTTSIEDYSPHRHILGLAPVSGVSSMENCPDCPQSVAGEAAREAFTGASCDFPRSFLQKDLSAQRFLLIKY